MVLAQPENKHVLKAFDLSGKVAAVTGRFRSRNSTATQHQLSNLPCISSGGARGIGLEVSIALAEAGADVNPEPSACQYQHVLSHGTGRSDL